jgi:hypothetical protein
MGTETVQRHKPAPLTTQVTLAERRLVYRHRMVAIRTSRLQHNLRDKLTSPAMVLMAGGLGFAVGHFQKQQTSPPDGDEGTSYGKLFRTALRLVPLATVLLKLRPSPAADSAAWSGWPSQVPEPHRPTAESAGPATS